ncbi:MAG: hypothetical protein ACYSWU_29500 [Planctomycetota bacterium]|jgi:hypothetical protein
MGVWVTLLIEAIMAMIDDCPEQRQARRREILQGTIEDLASGRPMGLVSRFRTLRAVRRAPIVNGAGELLMIAGEGVCPRGRRADRIVDRLRGELSQMESVEREFLVEVIMESRPEVTSV